MKLDNNSLPLYGRVMKTKRFLVHKWETIGPRVPWFSEQYIADIPNSLSWNGLLSLFDCCHVFFAEIFTSYYCKVVFALVQLQSLYYT